MSGDGWVRLYRKIQEHPAWSHDGMLKLWLYCCMEANYKDSTYLVPGTTQVIRVNRGSFITGREVLLNALYPHKNSDTPVARTVYRWMQSLEAMECLKTQNVSNRCTMVTVVNYDTYNPQNGVSCPTDVQPVSDRCPTAVRPMSTSEEGKEREEGKKKGARKVFSKPTFEQVAEYCRERSNSIDPQKFIDYYTANGWRVGRGTMCDWKAAVRNWETSQLASPKKKSSGPRVPTEDELANWNPYAGQD